jgi:hypothetical protein
MDVSHQVDLHVQRMSMWLLKAAWVVAIFRGALNFSLLRNYFGMSFISRLTSSIA